MTKRKVRETCYALTLLISLVSFFSKIWSVLALIPLLAILYFIAPTVLSPLAKFWFTLAQILNWSMTRLILTVVFFGVITPIGIVRSLFGKDEMMITKKSLKLDTAFVDRNKEYSKSDLVNPF